jgi:ankyrin repeat protein
MTPRANGGTPLHEAVHQKHEAMVELLLQHSANPFAENFHSRTAMDLAVASGNVAIIRMLERKAIFAGAPVAGPAGPAGGRPDRPAGPGGACGSAA